MCCVAQRANHILRSKQSAQTISTQQKAQLTKSGASWSACVCLATWSFDLSDSPEGAPNPYFVAELSTDSQCSLKQTSWPLMRCRAIAIACNKKEKVQSYDKSNLLCHSRQPTMAPDAVNEIVNGSLGLVWKEMLHHRGRQGDNRSARVQYLMVFADCWLASWLTLPAGSYHYSDCRSEQ